MRWINSLKNTAVLLICCVTALHICLPGLRASAMFTPTFDLQSKAAILYSTDTKEVLYAKNPDEKMMPGALVNLMTALICVENNQDLAGTLQHIVVYYLPLKYSYQPYLYSLRLALVLQKSL